MVVLREGGREAAAVDAAAAADVVFGGAASAVPALERVASASLSRQQSVQTPEPVRNNTGMSRWP